MKKYFYYTLFLFTLSFDVFFIYTVITSYNRLEEKTAWVQEAYIGGRARNNLQILPVYDPKYLKTPPKRSDFSPQGIDKERAYDKYIDSLRKNTKELVYERSPFSRKIAPVFGTQIFFYTFEDKYKITNYSIEMIGNYYFGDINRPSKWKVFLSMTKYYIYSILGLIFISFFFYADKITDYMPKFFTYYYFIKFGFILLNIFL